MLKTPIEEELTISFICLLTGFDEKKTMKTNLRVQIKDCKIVTESFLLLSS